jgi:high-affinity Fe2+/Pb2+ permease
MKAYLGTTGTLWALLAGAHVFRTFLEWGRVRTDLGFLVEGPGIGLVAAALCVWAWRLFARADAR